MKVLIHFEGDPSVGIFSYSFDMTIPEFEPEYREDTRAMIKNLYTELDGEFYPKVYFEDEKY
jgi:hypothetical protein